MFSVHCAKLVEIFLKTLAAKHSHLTILPYFVFACYIKSEYNAFKFLVVT